jgi:Ca-activated chloride channel homolog
VNWYRGFGLTELIFCGAFVLFYGLYVTRIVLIAKRLNTPFTTIFIKLFLRAIYFALFVIAMLGPSFGGAKKEVKSIGKDIMICIDLSKSMDAFDIQPTRLEKVKYEMKRLVSAFSSDRIGVIIFGSEAFMQCPLTYDQNALNLFIETINTNLVPSSGTDFGPALEMAVKKLKEDEENKTGGKAKSKVIILISDGEDFGEETKSIARDIEDENIKVFTLGVGTNKGGNINTTNGLKKDKDGNVVLTKLNNSSLQDLAKQTEGQYFEINATKNDVSRLINTISKIEGELRDARYVDVTANKYFYFLIVAFALLMIDVLINIRTVRI